MATPKEAPESTAPAVFTPDPALKTKLVEPLGSYATEFFNSVGIPVCSHCGDKESQACSEGYAPTICPMLIAKPKNTL